MRLSALLLVAAAAPLARAGPSSKLPSNVRRCKRDDPNLTECLRDVLPEALKNIKGGIPSLRLQPFDPLYVSSVEIQQGDGPISIKLKFTNITVVGLSSPIIHAINVDLNNYSLLFNGTIPHVVFESDYEMSGRMLLLPATGSGRCKLTFTDLIGTIGPTGKGVQKEGKTYFDVTEFYANVQDLKGLKLQFENLFNGDKNLGNTLNTLMNDNWKELWKLLHSAFQETIQAVFYKFSKDLFGQVAYSDIFID